MHTLRAIADEIPYFATVGGLLAATLLAHIVLFVIALRRQGQLTTLHGAAAAGERPAVERGARP